MLATLAGGTTLLFMVAGFCVGLRLIWMGRRTRGLPEITLGVGLFLIVGVGLPMQITALAMAARAGGPTTWADALTSASVIAMNAGWAGVWIFTWRVFRPDSKLARAGVHLAFAALFALSAAAVHAGFEGMVGRSAASQGRTLATVLLAEVLYVWTMIEAFGYWRRMKKRVALGLADPVVANRFLLWGLLGLFSFVSLIAPLGFTLAGMNYQDSDAGRLVTAISGLGCAVALWLAFMPPRAYVDRVRAHAPAAA